MSESTTPKRDSWMEMGEVDGRKARFQVNRVDSTGDRGEVDAEEMDRLCTDDDDDEYLASYGKSFRHFTREALPRMDNYRNIMSIQAAARPTLEELHNETLHTKGAQIVRINGLDRTTGDGRQPATSDDGVVKFGWIKGVLVRNLLNIWGVMLFLRLSWVIGQAGIMEGCLIIFGCSVVTLITALSMSAISTNGLIRGGGTYFMISRSLGPEFGASIGLIFSLANAVACAMYTVGFCESINDLFETFSFSIVDGGIQDMRIVGTITIILLLGIVIIGMEWEAKAQLGLLVILIVAMVDFMVGIIIGPGSDETKAKGYVGVDIEVFKKNVFSDYRVVQGEQQDFFSIFSVFFPAASGFLAGANISGDLKDPQTAIPKGTILAIILTTGSYLLMALLSGSAVLRDASGNVTEYLNGTGTFADCSNRTCMYGLQNSFQVMELVSAFGPLIYAGCFAATLSSALASLVSAPKVFQALCKDNLYPYISFFGKGYGKGQEPVRGYVLTFFIALAFILVGELNAIAPLISNFFLAAYALINFSTFHASLAKPVGWRPTFKYYNMWLSLLGAILCASVMFLISVWTALITLSCLLALYLIVQYRKPDVNWGSSTQAQTYKTALMSVQQLNRVEDHVKNYCPQILVLSGLPVSRPPLVDFAFLITKNISLLVCGNIVKDTIPQRVRNLLTHKAQNWLHYHKIKAFYSHIDDSTFESGAHSLMQASGLGKLRPNIVLMGFKGDWSTCDHKELSMYFNTVHKALDAYMSVAILRLQEGLDYSEVLKDAETPLMNNGSAHTNKVADGLPRNMSYGQMSIASSVSDMSPPMTPNVNNSRVSKNPGAETETPQAKSTPKEKRSRLSRADLYRNISGVDLPKEVINNLTQFQRRQKKGTIDVWWLYDDGGLTLLLPYIITTRRNWSECKLRVFTLANKKDDLLYEQRNMASLLSKFRIDYSDLKVIPDITKKPMDETNTFFDQLIKGFVVNDSTVEDNVMISKSELSAMKDKTNRHLRLRELLQEYSMGANLIVMTLPMPRKNVVAASLYMAWLETLTKGMPPFLLVRGNQQSVLTFYS
ncbi:Amino acid permease [Nesidiocoris tenuis]|uniref:Amino acid permease n=1 Tax=Nesidiocoris tenuis TaxID=355587 RepID=A0ABN7APV5_9HEMI|nr:Amino acid permease [Nesidiocoris tenuis]